LYTHNLEFSSLASLPQQLEMEIERLSQLTGSCSESLTLDAEERVRVINSSVNIQERIIKVGRGSVVIGRKHRRWQVHREVRRGVGTGRGYSKVS
jgi:hypothetical protein